MTTLMILAMHVGVLLAGSPHSRDLTAVGGRRDQQDRPAGPLGFRPAALPRAEPGDPTEGLGTLDWRGGLAWDDVAEDRNGENRGSGSHDVN